MTRNTGCWNSHTLFTGPSNVTLRRESGASWGPRILQSFENVYSERKSKEKENQDICSEHFIFLWIFNGRAANQTRILPDPCRGSRSHFHKHKPHSAGAGTRASLSWYPATHLPAGWKDLQQSFPHMLWPEWLAELEWDNAPAPHHSNRILEAPGARVISYLHLFNAQLLLQIVIVMDQLNL